MQRHPEPHLRCLCSRQSLGEGQRRGVRHHVGRQQTRRRLGRHDAERSWSRTALSLCMRLSVAACGAGARARRGVSETEREQTNTGKKERHRECALEGEQRGNKRRLGAIAGEARLSGHHAARLKGMIFAAMVMTDRLSLSVGVGCQRRTFRDRRRVHTAGPSNATGSLEPPSRTTKKVQCRLRRLSSTPAPPPAPSPWLPYSRPSPNCGQPPRDSLADSSSAVHASMPPSAPSFQLHAPRPARRPFCELCDGNRPSLYAIV